MFSFTEHTSRTVAFQGMPACMRNGKLQRPPIRFPQKALDVSPNEQENELCICLKNIVLLFMLNDSIFSRNLYRDVYLTAFLMFSSLRL